MNVVSGFEFSGSFTISTTVGTVTGDATGPIDFSVSPNISLAVMVTSGTGSFVGTTGTLRAAID